MGPDDNRMERDFPELASMRSPGTVRYFLDVRSKRKGLQLALEPLDGQGIAGYVPEP